MKTFTSDEVVKILNETEFNLTQLCHLKREQFKRLNDVGYLFSPASKSHHLNCEFGLAKHSLNVTEILVELSASLQINWPRPESPFLVGMLHDLVKCKCYAKCSSEDKVEFTYVQPEYPGHGIASVMIAAELGIELKPSEIAAITYHMGMFGVGREYTDKEFNAALAKYPQQIIATHCADWWAARVTEEGVFAVAGEEQGGKGDAR